MVLMLVAVLAALASAGVLMLRKGRDSEARPTSRWRARWRCAWRCRWRCSCFILLAWKMGWIQPPGIPVGP